MQTGTPARLALLAIVALATPAAAQSGGGEGFLFHLPRATLTVHGGFAQPLARSDVWSLATSELTLGRSDFGTGNFGADFGFTVTPRFDLVIGIDRSRSSARSEYRDFVEEVNGVDVPIDQSTTFTRTPLTASLRYYLTERGRRVGSVAWIPARFVPFVQLGGGATYYQFEQVGDFVDMQTLDIFAARLRSKGWAGTLQAGAGGQWNLNQRFSLTGELRYLRATGDGDEPSGDFSGYKVDLSGVSTLIGLTLRL